MPRYVVLLRAINVGKNRQVKMAELRALLERAGATDVATYIQSGNVVLTHPARSANKLAAELQAKITKLAGFDVPVAVLTAAEWQQMIDANPFAGAGEDHLHVSILPGEVAADALASFDATRFAPEAFAHLGRALYLHLPNGMGGSKLAVALSRHEAAAQGTARNWRTVHAIAKLI